MSGPRGLAISIVVALGASGCGGGSGSGSDLPPGAIVIGEIASLSGARDTFGASANRGVLLALEQRNQAGGIKGAQIALRTVDDASRSSEAQALVERLIREDHVVAVLDLGDELAAGAPGVPIVSPAWTTDPGYAIAKLATDRKLDRIAVLWDQAAPSSQRLAAGFARELVALHGTITTSQAYVAGVPEVTAQLEAIKASGAQAVFLPGDYTDVARIANSARKLGITGPFLGGAGWDSPRLAELGGAALEGSFFAVPYSFDEVRPEVGAFVTSYQLRWSETPDGFAAVGYDAARALFDAMERAPSLGNKDLTAAIAATRDLPGVTGKITLDAHRSTPGPMVIVQLKGGKPRYVATVVPR